MRTSAIQKVEIISAENIRAEILDLLCAYDIDKNLIRNLRVHGHNDLGWVEDFIMPDGHSLDILFSQDATAAIIRLLFPSSVGLVVNSGLREKLNDILKPETIVKIFRLIRLPNFFAEQKMVSLDGKEVYESCVNLFEALMPDSGPLKKKWNMCKENKFIFMPGKESQKTYDYTLKFTKLLFRAFSDNAYGKSALNGYPQHVIERVLLCYLCEKNNEFLNKDVSTFTKQKYPPAIEYGISCKDGREFYSDCGDTMLRNLFMMMLYNAETNKFDVEKLKELRKRYKEAHIPLDELIYYFEKICTSPEQADTVNARNKWIKVVNNLNDYPTGDDAHNTKVRYLAKDGAQHEIDVGLDNIINVISKILGPAIYCSNGMGTNMKRKINWLSILSDICEFFSESSNRDSNRNTWRAKLSTTNHKHDMEECEDFTGDVPVKGWVDLTVTFSYGNSNDGRKDIFECLIESNHFGFNKLYEESGNNVGVSTAGDIAGSIFSLKMNTYHEKIHVIDTILSLPCNNEQSKYLYLVKKWLDVNGNYFANWQNSKVNSALATVLLKYMSVEEILGLRIPKINYAIVLPLARMGRIDDIKKILADDLIRFREEYEFEEFLRIVEDKAEDTKTNQVRFSTASRALEETLLKGTDAEIMILENAGANNYANIISGLTLLHLAAYAGNNRLSTSFSDLDIDINAKTASGDTPLHFAARSGSAKTVQALLAAGAKRDAVNKSGFSAADVLSISQCKKLGLFSYFIGSGSAIDFIDAPYSQKFLNNDSIYQALKMPA